MSQFMLSRRIIDCGPFTAGYFEAALGFAFDVPRRRSRRRIQEDAEATLIADCGRFEEAHAGHIREAYPDQPEERQKREAGRQFFIDRRWGRESAAVKGPGPLERLNRFASEYGNGDLCLDLGEASAVYSLSAWVAEREGSGPEECTQLAVVLRERWSAELAAIVVEGRAWYLPQELRIAKQLEAAPAAIQVFPLPPFHVGFRALSVQPPERLLKMKSATYRVGEWDAALAIRVPEARALAAEPSAPLT